MQAVRWGMQAVRCTSTTGVHLRPGKFYCLFFLKERFSCRVWLHNVPHANNFSYNTTVFWGVGSVWEDASNDQTGAHY